MEKLKSLGLQWRHFILPLCAFIFTVFLFSHLNFGTFPVGNSTDSSWMYTLSSLRHSSQSIGLDIFFTYGPLYEIMPTIVHANDTVQHFIVGNIFFLTIVGIATWVFCQFFLVAKKWIGKYATFILSVIALGLVLVLTDIDTAFNILLICTVVAARHQKTVWLKLLMLCGVLLFGLYKFSYLIPVLALLPFVFIEKLHWRSIVRGLGLSLIGLLVCFGLFCLTTLTFSPMAFAKFMQLGFINTAFYGEFMGLTYVDHFRLVAAYTLFFWSIVAAFAVGAFVGIRKKGIWALSEPLLLCLAFLAIMFFDYKHAVVRNDIHLLSFTPFILLGLMFAVVLAVQFSKPLKDIIFRFKPYVVLACIVLAVIAHLPIFSVLTHAPNFTLGLQSFIEQKTTAFQHTSLNRLNFANFTKHKELSRQGIEIRSKDVAGIKEQLDKLPQNKLIFYGNTNLYGEAFTQKHTVLYTPFLQNYVAYPPQLADDLYIAFLNEHPDALVFAEENEASIDGRVPAHELNKFFQYLIHNYKIVAMDTAKGHFVFQRHTSNSESCQQFATISFKDGEQPVLPSAPNLKNGQYVKLQLQHTSHPLEKMASFLFKSPVYSLVLITPDGIPMGVRTTKTTLEHGVAIQPLYTSLRAFAADKPFPVGTFAIGNGSPLSMQYTADLQACSFGDTP